MNSPDENRVVFCPLQKHIETAAHLEAFRCSASYSELIEFAIQLSASIKGVTIQSNQDMEKITNSNASACLCRLLDAIQSTVELTPLEKGSHRFGNPSFREFHDNLSREAAEWLNIHVFRPHFQRQFQGDNSEQPPLGNDNQELQPEAAPTSQDIEKGSKTINRLLLTPSSSAEACKEVSGYLEASFGDRSRIDYGSGHELNFLCFLFCLFKLRIFDTHDFRDIIRVVFKKYLKVCRALQTKFKLEPAGSRGVWGIDDFQFLPFLFGSSQMIGNSAGILPSQAVCERQALQHGDEYLYLDAIRRIYEIKGGVPFGESSPLLNDISAIPTWTRIHNGMLKMYQAEVLGKLPVMQHFLFGSLIPYPCLPAQVSLVDANSVGMSET